MFLTWLRHFATHVKPSHDRPVLLITDGHSSHTRSLAATDFAREKFNGIVMLSLPPHSTHKLQPLDVAFFKPLQSYYIQEQECWLRTNQRRQITAFQIAGLFNKAYMRAASTATATKGFQKTGILPCNWHVFGEQDFLPSGEEFVAFTGFSIPTGQPGPSLCPSDSSHIPYKYMSLRFIPHTLQVYVSQINPTYPTSISICLSDSSHIPYKYMSLRFIPHTQYSPRTTF